MRFALGLALGWVALAVASCVPEQGLVLPPIGEAASRIVVFESALEKRAFAFDRSPVAPLPLTAGDFDRIYALSFDATLGEMMIAPGELMLADAGRALPPIRESFLSEGAGAWIAFDGREVIRLPAFEHERCWRGGGCIRGEVITELCELPCTRSVAPLAPHAPRLQPCDNPEGRALDWMDDAVGACAPVLHDPVCGPDELNLFNDSACAALDVCPSGDWPNVQATRLVRAPGIADPGGTYDSIASALIGLPRGGVIALSRGTHAGPVVIDDQQVTIVGACVRDTRIDGTPTALTVRGSTVSIAHLSVFAGPAGAALVADSGTVSVDRAQLFGPMSAQCAVVAASGSVALRSVHIAGCNEGVFVEGRVSLTRARLDTVKSSLRCRGGFVAARQVSARGLHALEADLGCRATIEGLRADTFDAAVSTLGRATTATVSDVAFTSSGMAAFADFESHLALRRAYAGSVTESDVPVLVQNGSSADFDGVYMHGVTNLGFCGVFALINPPRATLRRVGGFSDTCARIYVRGVGRGLFEDILLVGPSGRADSASLLIDSAMPGTLTVRRMMAMGSGAGAIDIGKNWELTIEDLDAAGTGHTAVIAQTGATVRIERMRLSDGTGGGLLVDDGAFVEAREVIVRGLEGPTLSQPGAAILLEDGGGMIVERFLLEDNERAFRTKFSLHVPSAREGGRMAFGTIRGNEIGLAIERDFDVTGVSREVVFEGNDVDLKLGP